MVQTVALVNIEFCLLAVACFFLIRYYKGKMVTFDVSVTVYMSWVLGFVGILLLPYDLSISLVLDEQSQSLIAVWQITYWSTFLLAWVVLPLQYEYHSSGHFSFKQKMYDAVVNNLLAVGIGLVAIIIYMCVMAASGEGTPAQAVNFLMAMGTTYGVLIITVLLGSGLISLPRQLWRKSSPQTELNCLYITASQVEAAFQESRFELEDAEVDVAAAGALIRDGGAALGIEADELLRCVGVLEQLVGAFEFKSRSATRKHKSSASHGSGAVLNTMSGLVALHVRLINAQSRAASCEKRWQAHLQNARLMENMLTTAQGSALLADTDADAEDEDADGPPLQPTFASIVEFIKRVVLCDVRGGGSLQTLKQALAHSRAGVTVMTYGYRALSLICLVFSVLVLWSEVMMASSVSSPFGAMMSQPGPNASAAQRSSDLFEVQMVSFLALCYMSVCTYWSLFRVNLGWTYKLQGPQQSTASSLIFNGQYFSRLQFSLIYNFLNYLHVTRADNTAFMTLMANAETIPVFGASMTVYVPLIMTLVALLTLFDGCTRLYRFVGIESDDVIVKQNWSSWRPWMGGSTAALSLSDQFSSADVENLEVGKKLVLGALRSKRSGGKYSAGDGSFGPGTGSGTARSAAGGRAVGSRAQQQELELSALEHGTGKGGISSSSTQATGASGAQLKQPKASRGYKPFSLNDDDEDGDARTVEDLLGTAISPIHTPVRSPAPSNQSGRARDTEKFANFSIDDSSDNYSKYGNI